MGAKDKNAAAARAAGAGEKSTGARAMGALPLREVVEAFGGGDVFARLVAMKTVEAEERLLRIARIAANLGGAPGAGECLASVDAEELVRDARDMVGFVNTVALLGFLDSGNEENRDQAAAVIATAATLDRIARNVAGADQFPENTQVFRGRRFPSFLHRFR